MLKKAITLNIDTSESVANSPVELLQGDTPLITVNVTTDGATPMDLTGLSALLTMAKDDVGVAVTGTISAPATGVITFEPTGDDTSVPGNWRTDISLTDGTDRQTLYVGRFRVESRPGATSLDEADQTALWVVGSLTEQTFAGILGSATDNASLATALASASGTSAFAGISGAVADNAALVAAFDGKIDENTPIIGGTKTKITYDADGLVTSGADATTADIADSLNKRYVTDSDLTNLGNLSGTNTGDQDLSTYDSHIADNTKHRLINDAGTSATDLFSAAEIISRLAGKEPANANIQGHISAITGNPHNVNADDLSLGITDTVRFAAVGVGGNPSYPFDIQSSLASALYFRAYNYNVVPQSVLFQMRNAAQTWTFQNKDTGQLALNGTNGSILYVEPSAPSFSFWAKSTGEKVLRGANGQAVANHLTIQEYDGTELLAVTATADLIWGGDTGFVETSDVIKLKHIGTERWAFDANRFYSLTAGGAHLRRDVGSAASPTYAFFGDEDNGMFRPSANVLGFSTAGTEAVGIDASQNVALAGKLQGLYSGSQAPVWDDMVASLSAGKIGVTSPPTWESWNGGNMYAYNFAVGDELWLTFHVPHTIDPDNNDIWPHIHWMTDDTGTGTANVKWQFDISVATGFDTDNFNATPTTVTVETALPTTSRQYRHIVSEVANAVSDAAISVDALILVRISRVAASANEFAGKVFGLTCDLHYQKAYWGTQNKAPSFY